MKADRRPAQHDASALAELEALYARADALFAGWSCPSSTECCRFGITGRQPYITAIEAALIRRALARRGGPLAPRKRALPLYLPSEREQVCPLLDQRQRCSVYAARPLGCRTYYCDKASAAAGPTRAQLRELTRQLQDLAARDGQGGEAARPLLRLFE